MHGSAEAFPGSTAGKAALCAQPLFAELQVQGFCWGFDPLSAILGADFALPKTRGQNCPAAELFGLTRTVKVFGSI